MGVVIYIIAKRRRSQSDQVYNVEAAQVDGPPSIIATEYNRTSGGLSGVYSTGPNEQGTTGNKQDDSTKPGILAPTHPVPSYQSDRPPTYTAPVSQVRFADQPYPFSYDAVSLIVYNVRHYFILLGGRETLRNNRRPHLSRADSLDRYWLEVD